MVYHGDSHGMPCSQAIIPLYIVVIMRLYYGVRWWYHSNIYHVDTMVYFGRLSTMVFFDWGQQQKWIKCTNAWLVNELTRRLAADSRPRPSRPRPRTYKLSLRKPEGQGPRPRTTTLRPILATGYRITCQHAYISAPYWVVKSIK